MSVMFFGGASGSVGVGGDGDDDEGGNWLCFGGDDGGCVGDVCAGGIGVCGGCGMGVLLTNGILVIFAVGEWYFDICSW